MEWIPGGTFRMGSDDHYPEEAPVRTVAVEGFWIDRCAVTTAQFAEFVRATGYVTVAERPLDPADFPGAPAENLVPGSLVFTHDARSRRPPSHAAVVERGRRAPAGGRDGGDHPVVHVACEDAEAYAAWAGKALPSEAEWERAARGGLEGAAFVWGDEPEAAGERLANFWHGEFPWRHDPGYGTTAAVGSYPPNGFGLHEMAGNTWEWTADWYAGTPPPDGSCCCPECDHGRAEP